MSERQQLRGCSGILEAIGGTPLIRLEKLFPDRDFRLYGKLEALNPGGSIKDRPAYVIVREAVRSGEIGPDTTVIESSSGNMGVGLAQVCGYLDLRFICVVDPKTSRDNIRVLEAYGAEVSKITRRDPETGQYLPVRLERVRELREEIGDAFWPNQYRNRLNPRAHFETTMHEIATAFDDGVDYLFVAISTCGTVRGCGEYIRDHDLDTRLIAVDAYGSVIFGDEEADEADSTRRSVPGLGAGIQPPHCDEDLIDRIVRVSDGDCVAGCRALVRREAILAGGSSGGVVAGVDKMADEIPAGSTCVAILCDRGERYLRSIYDDDWVEENCQVLSRFKRQRPRAEERSAAASARKGEAS